MGANIDAKDLQKGMLANMSVFSMLLTVVPRDPTLLARNIRKVRQRGAAHRHRQHHRSIPATHRRPLRFAEICIAAVSFLQV